MSAAEFCQVHTQTHRCVSTRNHGGSHDFQPKRSLTVQTIMRQEDENRRMGFGDEVVEAIDTVVDPAKDIVHLDNSNQPMVHNRAASNCEARTEDDALREGWVCQLCASKQDQVAGAATLEPEEIIEVGSTSPVTTPALEPTPESGSASAQASSVETSGISPTQE